MELDMELDAVKPILMSQNPEVNELRFSVFRLTFMSSKNRRTTAFGFSSGKFLENRASVFQEMRNTKNRKTRRTHGGGNNQKLKK